MKGATPRGPIVLTAMSRTPSATPCATSGARENRPIASAHARHGMYCRPTPATMARTTPLVIAGWGRPSPAITSGVVLAIVAGVGLQYIPWRAWALAMGRFSRAPLVAQGVALGVLLMAVNTM